MYAKNICFVLMMMFILFHVSSAVTRCLAGQGYCVTSESACPGFIIHQPTGCDALSQQCCIEDL